MGRGIVWMLSQYLSGDRLVRAIHLVRLDKIRPALVLTRAIAVPHLSGIRDLAGAALGLSCSM